MPLIACHEAAVWCNENCCHSWFIQTLWFKDTRTAVFTSGNIIIVHIHQQSAFISLFMYCKVFCHSILSIWTVFIKTPLAYRLPLFASVNQFNGSVCGTNRQFVLLSGALLSLWICIQIYFLSVTCEIQSEALNVFQSFGSGRIHHSSSESLKHVSNPDFSHCIEFTAHL